MQDLSPQAQRLLLVSGRPHHPGVCEEVDWIQGHSKPSRAFVVEGGFGLVLAMRPSVQLDRGNGGTKREVKAIYRNEEVGK